MNEVVKQASRWLADPDAAAFLSDLVSPGSWIYEHDARIAAYLDPPKTVEELKAAAKTPKPGYDIHRSARLRKASTDNHRGSVSAEGLGTKGYGWDSWR